MTSPWGKIDAEPAPALAPERSWAEMIDSRFDAQEYFKDGASYRAGSLAGMELILMAVAISFYAAHNAEPPEFEEINDIFETCGFSDATWVINKAPLELLLALLREMQERIGDRDEAEC